jgi:hypothetical protein
VDPESKKLLEETHKLAEENNSMLRSIARSMRISRIMTMVYWIVIIGAALGFLYFLQPYVEQVLGIYSGARDSIGSFGEMFKGVPR